MFDALTVAPTKSVKALKAHTCRAWNE